jgi:predicted RNase H-like HicB family nuclease
VAVHYDTESKTFWADNPDLDGLVVAGATPAELAREIHAAATTLIELQLAGRQLSPSAIVAKKSFPAAGYCPV